MTQSGKLKLRDYQENTVKDTAKALTKHRKVLVALPTGAGKSVVIGYIANNIKGRTLILTHRAEILKQNSEWLDNMGVLTRGENSVLLSNTVVIAMVQTLHARIKKHGVGYLGNFESIIIDEAHIDIFQKVYKLFRVKYLIGFTATPTMSKKELIVKDGIEYYRTITLKDQYDALVVGVTVPQLILGGHLVEDENYKLELPNMAQLKDSNTNPDGFTSDSLTKVYSNKASMKILWEAYLKYGKGKKVLLFNATTKVNVPVTKMFLQMGIETRNYDSVHSKPKEREGVVKWFEEAREAVLVGTNVFTTGFNVTDIEVVIVNRATKSLSLWIQMVGRGSRTTDKIFKNKFVVLDLGQNIDRHGVWSQERDWQLHFHPPELTLRKKKDITVIWECAKCGAYIPLADLKCTECGAEKPKPQTIKRPDKTGVIVEVPKTILPRANKIVEYAKAHDKGSAFAFKVLENQLLQLFVTHKVSKESYERNREKFQERIRILFIPSYFAIIKSELRGANTTIKKRLERLNKKIDKHYGI